MVGTEALISLFFCAILSFAIPITAVIVFKKKHPEASLLSAVIGAATFVVFALVMEQLLHLVMLPLVLGSTVAYVLYGTLAAGVFEETGRFVACKLLMKKRTGNANAVMMGIGHGGIEAIILVGFGMISYIATALMVNSMGIGGIAEMSGITDEANLALLNQQVNGIAAFAISTALVNIVERVLAMTLHISMSVVVMKAATVKGKLWLYPAAIVMHAVFDVPAALYQRGVIPSIWLLELILAVLAVGSVFAALKISKIGQENSAAE